MHDDPHACVSSIVLDVVDIFCFFEGQVQRKNNQQQQGVVRLFQMSPSGPSESFNQQVSMGPIKCVKFANLPNMDSGIDRICSLITFSSLLIFPVMGWREMWKLGLI